MSTNPIARFLNARARTALAVFLCGASLSCLQDPEAPEVSDTEIWRLELEQTDDGSTDIFKRRGTINLRLRLNHTTTPDPLCANRADPNATTFLASVEAIPSRLQAAATGNAVGTWNCFGFSAEVRLDDGTVYALVSDSLKFSPATPHWQAGMEPNRWVAVARKGYFGFGLEEDAGILFDSHMDVIVQNRFAGVSHIGLTALDDDGCWTHRDLPPFCYRSGSGLVQFVEVPASGTFRFSWPNAQLHVSWPPVRDAFLWSLPSSYEINVQHRASPYTIWGYLDGDFIHCFLDPDHAWQVELILEQDGTIGCGTGWVGSMYASLRPGRLFLEPGATDTIRLFVDRARSISAVSSDPDLRVSLQTRQATNSSLLNGAKVSVTATPGAPRREHGVTVTAVGTNDTTVFIVPVEVYELTLTARPDTVTLTRGSAGTADIRLNRIGLIGLDVALSVPDLPASVFSVPPSFGPGVTRGDSSRLTLRLDPAAAPGDYDLTVCAIIVADPFETCHAARVTLRVRSVQNAAPVVTIVTPVNGLTAPYTSSIIFAGSAQDPEEGRLRGNALVWTSSIDGPIGTDETVLRTVSVGVHTIRLTATDSEGASRSATVSITITDPNPSASISGRVTGNGFGVGGATLTLSGAGSATTTSGSDGSYAFTSLPAGTYTVTVSTGLNISFPARSQTVTLAPGQARTVNFAGTY